jgi:hypothetical protein
MSTLKVYIKHDKFLFQSIYLNEARETKQCIKFLTFTNNQNGKYFPLYYSFIMLVLLLALYSIHLESKDELR